MRTFEYFLKFELSPLTEFNYYKNKLTDAENEIVTTEYNKILRNKNDKYEIKDNLSDEIHNELCMRLLDHNPLYQNHCVNILKHSARHKNLFAIAKLFDYHKVNEQKISETDEYKYLLTVNSGVTNNLIGCVLLREKQYKQAVNYFLQAIEQKNEFAMMNMGFYHQTININHALMKKYYEMCKTLPRANFLLGMYYSYAEIDYARMVECFENSQNYIHTQFELGYFYSEHAEHNTKLLLHSETTHANKELSKKYFSQWIGHEGNNKSRFNKHVNEIEKLFDNSYEFYKTLKNITNPREHVVKKINLIEQNADFMKLIYKINVSTEYNIIRQCMVCFETKLNIFVNCGHLLCVDCYTNVDKCPVCNETKERKKRTFDDMVATDNRTPLFGNAPSTGVFPFGSRPTPV